MAQIDQFIDQYKLPIGLSILGIVLIVGGIFSSGLLSKPKAYPKASLVDNHQTSQIKVDISGAVVNPQVISLSAGSRVEDAIKATGGFSEEANQDFIAKSLNLSAKLNDGQKIYVPFKGENALALNNASQPSKISINSGSLVELESLPGVGPSTAQKIAQQRPYSSVNDLLTKKIVSKSVFEKIKDLIDL